MKTQKLVISLVLIGLSQQSLAEMFTKKDIHHYVGYQKYLAKKMKDKR
jgi:hypothetical protein